MRKFLFEPKFIPGIKDVKSYKYKTNTATDCCYHTFMVGFMVFVLSDVLLDMLLYEQFLFILIVLLFGIWVPFFKICYFYTDRIVVFFPLFPWERVHSMYYTDIKRFKWNEMDYSRDRLKPELEEGKKRKKWYADYLFAIPIKLGKRFYLLLKLLYDNDCPISHPGNSEFARRINYIFGTSANRPPRPHHLSPAEAKIEREAGLLIGLIVLIIAVFTYIGIKLSMR